MSLSEKQKQKKLAKKKQKRKVHTKGLKQNLAAMDKAKSYVKCPIHECLIPSNLFESGLGTAIVTRRTLEGDIAICAFIVDVFCLGIKNALFKVISENEYEQSVKPQIIESNDGVVFDKIHQTCARKLIEGAVQYANDLGFNSHPDYKNVKNFFGDIDSSDCPVKFVYGYEGKPFYMRGPHESINDAKKIIDKLSKKCGEDGFEYMIMTDE